jgi:PKD repeat protein
VNIKAYAQCTASFTAVQTANNEITFTNTSTGTGFFTGYDWDFGDGTNGSSALNPVHIYNLPATYVACLLIFDSTSSCYDTACIAVNVTGSVICALTTQMWQDVHSSCGTCADGSASVNVYGGAGPYAYSWNTLPQQTNSYATGLLPGMYTVCITDANGCNVCDSIRIDTSSCIANFSWVQSTPNTIDFTNTSTPGLFNNFQWNFGDSNIDSGFTANPFHHYNIPGSYSVCLFVSDSLTCADSICQTIVVTGTACNLVLSPTSTVASCPSCQDGTSSVNVSGGTGPYTYLWNNGSTNAGLTGLTPGLYSVCVTDANNCTQCANVVVGNVSSPCTASFTLYPDSTLQHVYFGFNLSTATAPATYVWSWGDGSSDTAAYPTHTYASAGSYTICLSLTDSTGCTSTFCDSMYLMKLANAMISVTILPQSTTGIIEKGSLNTLSIFPNPAKDYAVVRTNSSEEKLLSVTIINSLGNIVAIERLQNNTFDISEISQGVYFAKFQHQNGRISSSRLVIVR